MRNQAMRFEREPGENQADFSYKGRIRRLVVNDLIQRDVDELLSGITELENLLEKNQVRPSLEQLGVLAALVAENAPNEAIGKVAAGLKNKVDNLAGPRPARNASVEQLKDAAFRLRISLLALKRGGSPGQ
jgi:hypothetical protein